MNDNMKNDLRKIPKSMIGFLIMALGTHITKTMNIGMSPWDTLFLGVKGITQCKFGVITQIFGLVIIGISFLFKVYPGIGTLLNMVFFGYFLDLCESIIVLQVPASIGIKLIYIILGQIVLFYGIYVYLSCHFGAGPRDGLIIAISKLINKSIGTARISIEVIVFMMGWLLGGKIGVGTIVTTLLGGVLFDTVLRMARYKPNEHKHTVIQDYLN